MKYLTQKIKAASQSGHERAQRRWARDRKMRATLNAMDPIKFEGKILKRIVVIEAETIAREIVFYDFDRYSDRKRKLREARALADL